MSDQDTFEHILAALYDAMLDDARWPAASALLDDACGITGNDLMVGEGSKDDVRALFIGSYHRGQRREDLEREYFENYHPADERVPRFRQLPDSRLAHVTDLYTAEELKTSPTYNEMLPRAGCQDGLNIRLDGPDGSHITWGLGDPRRLGWLGVFAGRDGHGVAAPYAAVRPGPAGAGPRRSAEHDRDRPARQPADRRPPPGPPGAHHGGQRPCPEHLAAGRRVVGLGRDAPRPRAGRPSPSRAAGGRRAAGLRRGHGQWVDAAAPLAGVAAVRGARQARGRPSTGLRSAARRRAGADCRAGAPASCRSRLGGQNPGADADGDSGGGLVGGGQERARHGRGDRSHEKRHLWHLQQIYEKQSISRQADLVRLVLSLAEFG